MTLEEAKDILLKLESLVSKTNRQYKKGERFDSISFLKLHRKRISMFEAQEEAESIVRNSIGHGQIGCLTSLPIIISSSSVRKSSN